MGYINQNTSVSSLPQFNYSGSSFSAGEYDVSGLMYPSDLDDGIYGGHKVIFYINVSVDSRVTRSKDAVANLATVNNVQRDMRGTLIGEKPGQRIDTRTGNVVNNEVALTVASGTAVAAVGTPIAAKLGLGGGAGAAAGLATGALAGYAAMDPNKSNTEAGAAEEKAPRFTRPQKRLKAAIALYIPNNLQARYSVVYGEEETDKFSAVAKGASEIQNAVIGKQKLESAGNAVGIGAEILASIGLRNAPLGGSIGVATGIAANPKKEQAFKDVDFRSFTFEYQFSPKDSKESAAIMNIIRTFKYHMHPEFRSEDKFLYVYPSEFDIVYYKDNKENLNIHRHTSCVLTEMNLNYTPNGVFTSFPDGMPTFISMQLTFRELQLLTKETIEKYT